MDIQALTAFIAVAEHKSFSLAAEQLHLTQPAISKRIKGLEEQLNSPLFDRHNRSLSLTDTGHSLLPKAKEIVQLVRDTQLSMRNMNHQVEGRLKLGTSHHIGLHRLPPFLKSFVSQFPLAELNLSFMGSESAYQAVAQRKVELALTTLETSNTNNSPEGMISEVLWHDKMVFVCAKEHPLNQLAHAQLRDLSTYPAILPEANTFTFKLLVEKFKQQNLTLHTPMPTNYLETIKMLVSVGLGWSLLPESMLDNAEEIGLAELKIEQITLTRPLGFLYLQDRTLSNAAKAFIALIKA
ncbi:MAG: LysR family transcriptional regulator [Oleispira antarctica]|uniref:Transcriptional regulator, LysR family n=1 Tax=Oleispira antarctica RB-8 TaxID=698738 RepID=R4YTS0_OLEAN|nr:LysR family transcriptional regulator [Oleispira antarctica]MBQ0791261.1 LysR family transcriptional regulator [Oleispira antarctica]CCK76014.1 Transcriptional regulator, LysR family [Oleispira antarctica RB-8]